MEAKKLCELADRLFQDRGNWMLLQQELAEQFYPQRADFTVSKSLGEEYAADLASSYPILIRRDLGDQVGQMLRPTAKEWFKITPKGGEKTSNEGQRWLDDRTRRMRLAMYARGAQFTEATKQGDHDYVSFGNTVLSCRVNKSFSNLLYRTFHLRDVVWMEDEEGVLVFVARKWKPYLRDLVSLMKGNVAPQIRIKLEKEPFARANCYHIVCTPDFYEQENPRGRGYFSLSYDKEHQFLMEAVPAWHNEYIIPSWQRVSGSQYAFSPAAITALPDARMIQAMAYTLLEAGEKATNPPIIATEDAVRSDVSLLAGGITWVDNEYDEKMGAALRPLTQDLRGIPYGMDMIEDTRVMIAQAFFLNKLTLPQRAPEMTAYEVGQRVQEYIRGALPIFEPMESKYNGGICETTFNTLLRAGVLGSIEDIPDQIKEEGVEFEYRSPLHDAIEEQKGQLFLEATALTAEGLQFDSAAGYLVDSRVALRDALSGVGVPAEWMHAKDEVDAMIEDAANQQDEMLRLEQAKQGSEIAKNISSAGQQLEMV